MQKNETITLEITDITADGSGIGKANGMAVFVPLTAVGDVAEVKILKVKKTLAFAKLERLITPSPDRVENDCFTFRQCGGCAFRHIGYEAECRLKERKVYEAIKRIGGIDLAPMPLVPSSRAAHYRNKAQYPLAEDGSVGFYARHSHRIVACEDCALQPAVFGKIAAVCSAWIREYRLPAYREESGQGLLRHLYIRLAEATGEMMVCLVINGEELPHSAVLIERLRALCGERLKSVQININREKTNVIVGSSCKVLFGSPFITDVLCGVRVRLSPFSFYQVNRTAAEALYRKAADYAQPAGKVLLDLYCGAGTIGLSMASAARRVIGAEIVPEAVEDARFNAKENGIGNAEFLCADAAEAAKQLAGRGVRPDVVIVDPPRKGLAPEVIETVATAFCPERVVYVSCDPATLARDLKQFAEKGYRLVEYTPFDLFPRTTHVETVVQLVRKKPDTYIDITVDMDELDLTSSEAKATYDEIKDYVFEGFGLKVSSLNIAQVKTKCGIIERENYNKPKSENVKQPQCTKDKEEAIMNALRHFKMI